MKKILILLSIIMFGTMCSPINAQEVASVENAPLIITAEEMNKFSHDSREELIKLKNEYMKNIPPVAWIYLSRYKMYELVKGYEYAKDDFRKQAREADSASYDIRNSVSYYDSNSQKRIYSTVSKDESVVLKAVIENLTLLEQQNKKTLDNLKEKAALIKNNPDHKKMYEKEDLKNFRRTVKMANKDYKSVKSLNEALKDSAKVNKIQYSEKVMTSYKTFNKPYNALPTRQYIEDDIIKNSSEIACKTDAPAYYNKINQKRQKVLPILSSLLVTAETNKELELKRKAVYDKISNLSDKEKNATLSKLLAEEEAVIMKALEAEDVNNKIKSFSDEQKAQYNKALKILNEITLLQLDRLVGQVADAYSAYKSSNGDVLNTLSAYSAANPAPTYEEKIYIEIIQNRGSNSSKKILEMLNSYDATVNLEKNVDKSMETGKQKKAKKIKDDDMDFE